MADILRWTTGETDPKMIPVALATVIEIGDLLYLDGSTKKALPAGDLTYLTTLASTQEAFHDVFLGVAMQRSRSSDDDDIRVATRGTFLYPCPSATHNPGDLVGMDDNAGGTALLDQQLIGVATANLAVGRVTKKDASAAALVEVEIVSTVYHGGPQAMA